MSTYTRNWCLFRFKAWCITTNWSIQRRSVSILNDTLIFLYRASFVKGIVSFCLPETATALCQPLDVVINKPVKSALKRRMITSHPIQKNKTYINWIFLECKELFELLKKLSDFNPMATPIHGRNNLKWIVFASERIIYWSIEERNDHASKRQIQTVLFSHLRSFHRLNRCIRSHQRFLLKLITNILCLVVRLFY